MIPTLCSVPLFPSVFFFILLICSLHGHEWFSYSASREAFNFQFATITVAVETYFTSVVSEAPGYCLVVLSAAHYSAC